MPCRPRIVRYLPKFPGGLLRLPVQDHGGELGLGDQIAINRGLAFALPDRRAATQPAYLDLEDVPWRDRLAKPRIFDRHEIDELAGGVGKLVYFMSIEEARFRKPVAPGDILEIKVSRLRGRPTVWKCKGEATVDGNLVAEAQFTAMILDREPE